MSHPQAPTTIAEFKAENQALKAKLATLAEAVKSNLRTYRLQPDQNLVVALEAAEKFQ